MEIKQVIVVRKDLNMRKGKMVAQGCHASVGAVLQIYQTTPYTEWRWSGETKVCVGVDSEEELRKLREKAIEEGIVSTYLVTDKGTTEFNGIPTVTALAIGPDLSEKIDKVTKDLKLL